jgi:hypothetical protein
MVLCAEQDKYFPLPNTSCFISQIQGVQASSIQLSLHVNSIETELYKKSISSAVPCSRSLFLDVVVLGTW